MKTLIPRNILADELAQVLAEFHAMLGQELTIVCKEYTDTLKEQYVWFRSMCLRCKFADGSVQETSIFKHGEKIEVGAVRYAPDYSFLEPLGVRRLLVMVRGRLILLAKCADFHPKKAE